MTPDIKTSGNCPSCGKEFDSFSGVSGNAPKPGQRLIGLCRFCAVIMTVDDDGTTLRVLRAEEMTEQQRNPQWPAIDALAKQIMLHPQREKPRVAVPQERPVPRECPIKAGMVLRLSSTQRAGFGVNVVVLKVCPDLREFFRAGWGVPKGVAANIEALASALGAVGIVVGDPEKPGFMALHFGMLWFGEHDRDAYADPFGGKIQVEIITQ